MRKLAFLFLAACALLPAVSLSNVSVMNISHSDALIGFNFAGWGGNLRIRVTTGATSCAGGTGGEVRSTTYTSGSHLTGGGNYYQYIVTGLTPGTVTHVCPEISSGDLTGDWTSGNEVVFTTQSLPAVHPAPPQQSRATVPEMPDMSGACVWKAGVSNGVDGTDGTTHCTGESTPDCSTFMSCWNAAMSQQMAHKTVVELPSGQTIVHRNYITTGVMPDVTTFDGSAWTTSGANLTNSYAEGQGLVFSKNFTNMPGPGLSGDTSCNGMREGAVYYVHHTSGSAPWSDFQLTCDAPFSQGGTLLRNRALAGGTFYMAQYPRPLNFIRVTSTDAFNSPNTVPPAKVRTNPVYQPHMAVLTQDTNSNIITQDGTASVWPYVVRFNGFDSGAYSYMAANQWWDNIEIAAPSFCSDTVNGCDGYGPSQSPSAMIMMYPENSNIWFDRVYIHGQPWPNRMKQAVFFEGLNVGFINSYMDNLSYGRKMLDACTGDDQNDTWHMSDSPNMIRSSFGPGPMVLSNNYVEGTGIPMHWDGGGEWNYTSDISVLRNTWTSLRSHLRLRSGVCPNGGVASPFPEDPLWDGHAYAVRQPLEFKGGRRIKIEGNVFNTSTRHTSTGTIQMTSVTRQGILDVDITNNTFEHVHAGITAVSTGDGQLHTRPFDRVRIANNLVYDLNGDHYNGWINHVDGVGAAFFWNTNFGGYFLNGFGNGEDYIVDHNTVTINPNSTQNAAEPGLINLKDWGSEGMQITNNILNMTNENGANGIKLDGSRHNPTSEGGACGDIDGTALFSCYFPTSVVKNNLLLATVGSQSTVTNAGNGWVNGGPSGFTNANWTGLVVPSNPQMNPGYTVFTSDAEGRTMANMQDPTIQDANGTFISGRQGGVPQYGVDYGTVAAAQGKVFSPGANSIGTTAATISFYAPDTQACPVDVSSTSATAVSGVTRFTDGGSARARTVSLTGLTTGTRYYAKIQCAAEQPIVVFRTK